MASKILLVSWILFTLTILNFSHVTTLIQENRAQLSDRYELVWTVNYTAELVRFVAIVQTTGYIGFGLSVTNTSGMTGADIVIGGVDGSSYFEDYHGLGSFRPEVDPVQNWFLISATENSTHTVIEFERNFNTGDTEHDLPIRNGSIGVIWSIGSSDRILYHGPNRDTTQLTILNL